MKKLGQSILFFLFPLIGISQSNSVLPDVKFLDEYVLEDSIFFDGNEVGGLSSIDYHNGNWYLICDDSKAPRFYRANIRIDSSQIQFIEIVSAHYFTGLDEESLRASDPEGLRLNPKNGNLIWTSEGAIRKGYSPGIREANTKGEQLSSFPISRLFQANEKTGPRHNGVFEGLTLSVNGKSIWVAMEEPLKEDGPEAEVKETNSPIRVVRHSLKTKKAGKQFAYELDPVARPAINGNKTMVNGVSEILQITKHEFLFIERSFSGGYDDGGLTVKLYHVNTKGATNISKIKSLKSASYKTAKKTLMLEFDNLRSQLTNQVVDNLEGICFGPNLPNGNQTLMIVSDNNFNNYGPQLNQFLLFEVIED